MKGRQSGRSRKKHRPQRKSQRPAYAKRTSWVCPTCRHKITQRSKSCLNCGFRRDGLNRPPSRKDILRAHGIEYDSEGFVLRGELMARYTVEILQPGDGESEAEWEADAAFDGMAVALHYAKLLATPEDAPAVRVMDSETDEEVWNSTTGIEVIG